MMNMNQGMFDPNADRSPDMMPTQSPFMKYVSPFPRTASTKAPANFKAKIVEAAKDPENVGAQKLASALPRKNKYCGGTSKPYSSPLSRTGIGSKSTKQKIKEYGQKKNRQEQLDNARSSNPDSYANITKSMKPIPVTSTMKKNIKKRQ